MGQRTVSDPSLVCLTEQKATGSLTWSLFTTEIGWCGLGGSENRVHHLFMGHHSCQDVREKIERLSENEPQLTSQPAQEADWYPELRERLQDYFQGVKIDFHDIKLSLPRQTAFQSKVIQALQSVGYGEQITYGELASKAGAPRAARAVGTVMANNRIPVLIPCHRVVASGGKLGGFSAPQGTSLKSHLLQLESRNFD